MVVGALEAERISRTAFQCPSHRISRLTRTERIIVNAGDEGILVCFGAISPCRSNANNSVSKTCFIQNASCARCIWASLASRSRWSLRFVPLSAIASHCDSHKPFTALLQSRASSGAHPTHENSSDGERPERGPDQGSGFWRLVRSHQTRHRASRSRFHSAVMITEWLILPGFSGRERLAAHMMPHLDELRS